jgi:hypothetical protein
MTSATADLSPVVLTRAETMKRLRMKPAFFSKLTSGKVKGVPPLPCVRVGRKQLFLEESLNKWMIEVEAKSCNGAR